MQIPTLLKLLVTVASGIILTWCVWVSASTLGLQVSVAEVRQEVTSEIESIKCRLDLHYDLLKEIRDDQKKRK